MPSVFLSEIILITIAAFIGGYAARSVKLPPVLGYIVSGVIFGIIGKNFFQSYDSLVTLSQFGVSLLLFTLGFEISLDVISRLNKKIFIVGIMQVILMAAVIFPIIFLLGLPVKIAILFSVLFSFSSTALVVKILEEKGLLNDYPGNNVFIYLFIQDLFIVPVIFLLPFLFSKGGITSSSILSFVITSAKPLFLFVLILIASKYLLSRLLKLLFRYPSHELTILATIFTATLSILVFSYLGLPQSIAAFLAGVLISEQGKNLAPLTEIRPFRDLFLVLFFVVIGMLLDFPFFIHHLPLILALSILVVFVKFIVVYLILRFAKYSPSSSVFISSYMSNIGELSVVVGQIAFVTLLISRNDYNLLLSVFILSLLYVPLWIKYSRKGAEKMARLGILNRILPKETRMSDSPSIHHFKNHVVICGHGRVGREVRSMLDLAAIPYVVLDFNRKVIDDLAKESKYAIYGDPTDTEILKASFIEDAKVLVVAVPDSFSQKKIIDSALKLNPKILIICRSHVESDRYDLINLGVNTIIVPEMEAGFRIGEEVLDLFDVKREDSESFTKRLRRQHLL